MSKDLIKENSATKKVLARNILASVFVLFVLIGIFSPMAKVHASAANPQEACTYDYGTYLIPNNSPCGQPASTTTSTLLPSISATSAETGTTVQCTGTGADGKPTPTGCTETTTNKNFEEYIGDQTCGISSVVGGSGTIYPGCFLQISYAIFYSIPAFLLAQVAFFFNILISVTLSSDLLKHPFVGKAWGVVRDLSNIFFILILLYIAIKLILGIGGSEVKKMIANVIIMALLINFSMFFTQVIIDTSNILALIFYNKVSVDTTIKGQTEPRPYTSAAGEKDVAGGMVSAFDPTKAVSEDFIKKARTRYDQNGQPLNTIPDDKPPTATLVAIMITSALIMGIAIYALIVSGLSFLGRLIELWILIIFSPFAFMSYTVPKFASVEYLGWDAWFKRLLKVAFMAPIFMFFLYFIFMLIEANLFTGFIKTTAGTDGATGIIKMLLGIVIPAIFICVLLLKATKYAKEGSGQIGEAVFKGAKMVGGLALGAAAGGLALAGSNTIGRVARNAANNDETKAKAAAGDKGAQRKLALANSFAKNSFDARQTGIGKFASQKSGMDFNKGTGMVGLSTDKLKGGRKERDEEKFKKEEEKRKSYELSPSAAVEQNEFNNKYIKQKDEAKAKAEKSGTEFNEEKFKDSYETFAKKRVGTFKDINNERRQAYALSLENPAKKIEDGEIIKKSMGEIAFSGFKSGALASVTTPGGLATTAAVGAATMGIGLVLTPVIGGLVGAIKDMAKASAINRAEERKAVGKSSVFNILTENKDLVARIGKEKTDDQKLLELLKNRPGIAPEAPKVEEVKEEVKKEEPKK